MSKSIIKELIIVLLLALAIILVLGILLYEYVPISKTIPNEVTYTIPEEAKKELQEVAEVDESQIVMTYEINSSDLNDYRRTQNYKPGRANPFGSTIIGAGTNTANGKSNGTENSATNDKQTTQGNTTAKGTTTSNAQTENTNNSTENATSGGRFFKDTGTK